MKKKGKKQQTHSHLLQIEHKYSRWQSERNVECLIQLATSIPIPGRNYDCI